MKIKIGRVYKNRTLKYILPLIKKYHDNLLITMLNSVGILAVGIGDMIYDSKLVKNQHVFVLIDNKANPSIFNELIEYVMDKDYYEDDYPFDNLLTGRMQMVIFKLPKDIIKEFLEGKYSKLYYYEDARDFILDDNTFNVLIKSKEHKATFIKELQVEFGTTLTMEELGDRELDIPPKKPEEFFNYRYKNIF
jgi:Fe-S cluster assembly iron-binding protein IscA